MGSSVDGPSPVQSSGQEAKSALPSSVQMAGQELKTSVRQRETPAHQHSAAVLHEGEIVRGMVLEVLSPTTARIELPSGTVEAIIPTGQLHRGDMALFRVQAVEPAPVLVVHGIAGDAMGLHESDIVRILGVQANPVTLETVRTLRGLKHVLTADDLGAVLAGLSMPPGSATMREQIEIIGRMLDAGIPLEPKFYSMMESLFVGGKAMKSRIDAMRTAENAPPPTKSAIDSLVSAVEKSYTTVRDILRRFSMPGSRGAAESIYEALKQVAGQAEANAGSGAETVREAALGIMETMEAQQVYNIFALQHNAVLVFHVLLPFRDDMIAGRIEIDVDRPGGKEGPQAFRITTDMSALGEVTASGFAVRKMLSLTILTDTADDAEFVDQYRDELARGLSASGFLLQSLTVRNRQNGDEAFPRLLQRVNLVV